MAKNPLGKVKLPSLEAIQARMLLLQEELRSLRHLHRSVKLLARAEEARKKRLELEKQQAVGSNGQEPGPD